MMKRLYFALLLTGCLLISLSQRSRGQASSQYPIADKIADKIIHDYQTSSCQQLAEKKKQPPTAQKEEMEQKAIAALKKDPQMRKHFLDRIAGPVVNKMFECGMIP
jgi:dephospho-CoA kinase